MQTRLALALVALLCLCSTVSLAVDRNNFKKCDQSSFCARNRNLEPGNSHFTVVSSSVAFKDGQLTADILNTRDNVVLTLQVSGIANSIFRVKVNEKAPRKPRYEVKDVLLELRETPLEQDAAAAQGANVITIRQGKHAAVLTLAPFRLDVVTDDRVIVTLNGRGLMNFEHLRDRTENEQAGAWEETFKTWTDSKPNGPESIGLDISFPGVKHVFGIPEHASPTALKPTKGDGISSDPYRLFNLDVFEYELDNPMALYGSIPFMVAHAATHSTGVFWMNAAETWIDVSNAQGPVGQDATGTLGRLANLVKSGLKSDSSEPRVDTHWISEAGIIDLFILTGPRVPSIFRQYSQLTGVPALPPMFSIAYHQCRWNYNDEDDVANVDAGFDANDIPYDVLWLDIEHTDGKKYLTWDAKKFPDSKRMQDRLASKGHKMVTIVDPHIKREANYWVHSEAEEQGLYVKKADGTSDYEGWCWPGSSSWIDFLRPSNRNWWSDLFSEDRYVGSTKNLFIWNDMNEPSVFNGPEITITKDAIHHGGWENRHVHNQYGFYQQMATADGLSRRTGYTERPFVLTRAFFAGSQRYGAIWTGDNTATWDHLIYSTKMLLTMNLAGLPFAGADVGGFFGNPDAELLTRWYQVGAFQPFFRGHAHIDTKRREPWLFGEAVMTNIRTAIRARYSFLPYWYTLFHNAAVKGMPIMRPLWMEYPSDESTFAMDDQFLVGRDILVKPVTSAGATTVNVYFPGDQPWYNVETGTRHSAPATQTIPAPLERLPVFQRGGSIVPRKMRVRRSTALMTADPFTLYVALDQSKSASGTLYLDDGHSFSYTEGAYLFRQFTFANQVLTSTAGVTGGVASRPDLHKTSEWVERVVVYGYRSQPTSVTFQEGKEAPRSLNFVFDAALSQLTIKKPGVNIAHDWTITIA
ncbi:neutral alpha-glucosidase AB [Capsaspora owczarzaki ATCC 30864]|uniref:Glucosidase II subunit alpha n=1 Tax=Capsaspora owczarzaki (strain ATCC 30864) TaxID=595528 RepID=A0A0D2WIC1_CAPO3|nr:neutral alpha-glucosidase AB [Capsaspora owczarzaki ATCC 30864]KJE88713.1 neutral alpha-glucosidase AB [Capsaspora owczarzaki ATCC 30864]|eukprot:XP_004365179.2 neutral alpha-glucosidase AB [Capsaspora owczarzaki ATCC 30864]